MNNLTSEELKYLKHVLYCASNFTVARGEQLIAPSVKHKVITNKIESELYKRYQ